MRLVPLRHAAEVVLGRQRAPEYEHGDGQTPYLRSANIGDGRVDLADVKTMRFSYAERLRFGLQPGDVLVTEGSGSRDTVGASAVWLGDVDGPVCFQNTLLRLRPRAGVSGRYLAWWARHAHASGLIAAVASGANILHVGADAMGALAVALPPLEEQKRIAAFLDDQVPRLDAAAATAHKLGAILDLRLTAAWATAYEICSASGPLVPLRRLIASIVDGPFGSGLTSAHYTDSGTRVIRLGNIGVAQFRADDAAFISAHYAAQLGQHAALSGDVVMAGLGDDRWPLGRATVVPTELGAAIVKADCYRLRPLRGISPDYLACALSAPQTQEAVKLLSRGSTRARLNTKVAREVPIVLVGETEQGQLVRNVRMAQRDHELQRALLGRQLDLLQERKRALITACVTGEFDVTTASGRARDAALAHLSPGSGLLAE